MVFLRNISINTLHKGDDDDDDNNYKKVMPVIIGATGTISKTFRKYVSNVPGNHVVKKLQKT